MNSSPDSSASMDEIVFVPLMIDESSSSRHRPSRRKPKHPQKIPSSHLIQNHQPPPAKRLYYHRHSSSGDSSGDQSSSESHGGGGGDISNFYFGEHNLFSERPAGMFCRVEDQVEDDGDDDDDVDKDSSSGGGLSYNDLAPDISSPDDVTLTTTTMQQRHKSPGGGGGGGGMSRELFLPAPNGDGFYILTTTSPSKEDRGVVKTKIEEEIDDAGFSIYDNLPLNDDDDDDDGDNDGAGDVSFSSRSIVKHTPNFKPSSSTSTSSSSSRRPTGKLKILTMEMRPEDNDDGGSERSSTSRQCPQLVETTIEYSDDDASSVSVAVGSANATVVNATARIINSVSASSSSSSSVVVKSESIDEELETCCHSRLIQCEHCDRLFDEETRMRRHLKLVHGPKSFFCPECSKSFTQYGHMQVHLRTVHTSVKPFECNVCHRKFNVSSNRNRHQRLHFTKGSLHFVPEGATLVMSSGGGDGDGGGGGLKEAEEIEAGKET